MKDIVTSEIDFENISDKIDIFLSVFTIGLFNNKDKSLFSEHTLTMCFISERVSSNLFCSTTKPSSDFAYLDESLVAFILLLVKFCFF